MFDSVLTTFLYFIFVRVTKQSPLEDCQEFSFSTAGKRKKSIYFEFCAQLPLRKPNYFVVCISYVFRIKSQVLKRCLFK